MGTIRAAGAADKWSIAIDMIDAIDPTSGFPWS
jgi:hypothetical protein